MNSVGAGTKPLPNSQIRLVGFLRHSTVAATLLLLANPSPTAWEIGS